MDKEPLLPTINTTAASRTRKPPASTPTSVLCPLPEDDELFLSSFFFPPSPTPSPSSSFKDRLIFGGGAGEPPEPPPSPIAVSDLPPSSSSSFTSDDDPSFLSKIRTTGLHRSRTAPAMSTLNDVLSAPQNPPFSDTNPSSAQIVRQAILFLLAYLSFGVLVYTLGRRHFTSTETHPVVDALYFSIVTMCTIGYGDITPHTALAKVFSIGFVLIGFGFIDILLTGMVQYVLDLQESILLSAAKARKAGEHDVRSFIVDFKKGRMRIRMKVGLALGVVFLCIGVGMGVMHFVEQLGWLDSFYLSVMSVTTVGYGDQAFKSLSGRMFASIWLLVSTLAVARAFLYLAEYRIDKRHRMIAKWVLGRDMTVSEFLAADIDNNGFVSKSEYVVYKLKEMGRISEKDIVQICNQFKKLDTGNCGKITLSDLIGSHNGISRDR